MHSIKMLLIDSIFQNTVIYFQFIKLTASIRFFIMFHRKKASS